MPVIRTVKKMEDDTAYLNLILSEPALTSNCLRRNLEYVEERRAFQNISENNKLVNLISTINTKLHMSGNDRFQALLLLETVLTQCSADLLTEYLDGWMQQCLRWNQNTVDDELRVLRILIEKSVSIPGAKQHLITNILRQFSERLTSVENIRKSTQTVMNVLRCVKSFIHCYSSSCGNHRGTFQKYVTYCLTEHRKNERIIFEAAACFVALCECGSKGQQGIHFKDAWSSKFNLLINTCHKLLDSLYSNVNVVGLVAVEQVEEFLPELADITNNVDDTPMKRYNLMMERFFVVAEVLRAMLLCKYSALKSLRSEVVLNLISRVLSVNESVLQKCTQTNDILALTAIIPELHVEAFEILRALITTLKVDLIPYGSLICKLCVQSLKWTNSSEWAYGSRKPFQSLRCKAYSILCSWMSVVGSCSGIEIFADELIPIIGVDIEFEKPAVKLTVTTKPSKTGKSRKRGHMVTEMNMLSDSSILIDREANADVCVAAHRALQSLLRCASASIEWEHHKYFQSVILPLLVEMYNSQSSTSYPLPYSNSRCRQCLFASLLSLVQTPHPQWTTPLSLANRFLSIGIHDANVEVASFCRTALCQIEPVMHPRCPSYYYRCDIAEILSKPEVSVSAMPIEESSDWIKKTGPPRIRTVFESDGGIKRVQWDKNVSVHTSSITSSVEPMEPDCNVKQIQEGTSPTAKTSILSSNDARGVKIRGLPNAISSVRSIEVHLKSSTSSVNPVLLQPDSEGTKFQEGTSPTANTSTSSSNKPRGTRIWRLRSATSSLEPTEELLKSCTSLNPVIRQLDSDGTKIQEGTSPTASTSILSSNDARGVKICRWPSAISSIESVEAHLKSSTSSVNSVLLQPDSNVTKIQEGTSPTANTSIKFWRVEPVRESSEVTDISEPRAKKIRISFVHDQKCDEKFMSMLDDFVDS